MSLFKTPKDALGYAQNRVSDDRDKEYRHLNTVDAIIIQGKEYRGRIVPEYPSYIILEKDNVHELIYCQHIRELEPSR